MFRSLLTVITFCICVQVVGEIIPIERRVPWQGNVGIPDGIPNRTTIFTNVAGIDKTGATDVRAALQAIINSCPSNQVVFLPTGTYRLNAPLYMKSYVTLRGAGSTNTVLTYRGTEDSVIKFGAVDDVGGDPQWYAADERDINSSPSPIKGDTSFTVASISSKFAVSNLMTIDILNANTNRNATNLITKLGFDGQLCDWCSRANGGRLVRQTVVITNVSGSTVSFTPALYWNYTNTLSPKAIAFVPDMKWSGVEDLKVFANGTSGGGANFRMFGVAYCWVKNVEGDYCDGDHADIEYSVGCEIRDSYFHDGFQHTAGNSESCVTVRTASSACLVENNIIRRGHLSFMLEWGASGNVFGYNYCTNGFDENAPNSAGFGHVAFHGAHCMMNLFEGNKGTMYNQDGVWGSESHNTVFRNFWSGETWMWPPTTGRSAEQTNSPFHGFQGAVAVQLTWNSRYFNVVGNVLGSVDLDTHFIRGYFPGPQEIGEFPAVYMYKYPQTGIPFDEHGTIFMLGYDGLDDTLPGSTNVFGTLLNHGNWDIASKTTKWDATISDTNLVSSYYLSGKPSWWGSGTWPSIGPDQSPMAGAIPAQNRYFGIVETNQPVRVRISGRMSHTGSVTYQ